MPPPIAGSPPRPLPTSDEAPPTYGQLLREVLRGREVRVTAISCVVHMLLIVVLALFTIAQPQKLAIELTASVDSLSTPLQLAALTESFQPIVSAGPRVRSTATILAPNTSLVTPGRTAPPAVVSSGLNDLIFRAAAKPGGDDGLEEVRFFDTVGYARKIVFVVDASGSMDGFKFERCKEELLTAISNFTPNQRFYVIFFNDTDYPMFEPRVERAMLPVTTTNWERLARWVGERRANLGTKPKTALRKAFNLKPDAIFLLTDGVFTDDTYQFLMTRPEGAVRLHTIGFQLDDEENAILEAIAKRYHGDFTKVE